MQYYTAQQLQGSVKFTPSCLIGNWNEDVEQHSTKLKDFLRKKEAGGLKLEEFQHRISSALRDIELTVVRDDGLVHFGDVLQLAQADSGTVLACDVKDKDPRPGELIYAVTGAPSLTSPCARNTFLIVKYKPPRLSPFDTYYDDDTLRYGQKIRLVANPGIAGQPLDVVGGRSPLCLFSRPVSTTHFSKYSRRQIVGLTNRLAYDTVWQVLTPNPEERVVSEGREVAAGQALCLVHCATKQALCLGSEQYPNDFGVELEASAHSVLMVGKRNGLEHSRKGEMRGSMEKPTSDPNNWHFIVGDKVQHLPAPEASAFDVSDVLSSICAALRVSPADLNSLAQKLLMMDRDGSGSIVREEFLLGLRCAGLDVPVEDVQLLVDFFSADAQNHINARAFLEALSELA